MHSIHQDERGARGDLNRKFGTEHGHEVDAQIVEVLKELMRASDAVLNLHDGSGFYDPVWRSDERMAWSEARALGRGLVVDFWADWCDACWRLERQTFAEPEVRRAIAEQFVALRIDVSEETRENREQLQRYGVVQLPNDEAKSRKVFEYAKRLKLEGIVSEPPTDAIGLIDRLADEYGIKVAIYNHPAPSLYFDCKAVI